MFKSEKKSSSFPGLKGASSTICTQSGFSSRAQRTSLYLPPSLHQHFHIPSRSLAPPFHLLLFPLLLYSCNCAWNLLSSIFSFIQTFSAPLSASLIPFRVQRLRGEDGTREKVLMAKMQKEFELKRRKKGKCLLLLHEHISQPTGVAGSPARSNCLFTFGFSEFYWGFSLSFYEDLVCWRSLGLLELLRWRMWWF